MVFLGSLAKFLGTKAQQSLSVDILVYEVFIRQLWHHPLFKWAFRDHATPNNYLKMAGLFGSDPSISAKRLVKTLPWIVNRVPVRQRQWHVIFAGFQRQSMTKVVRNGVGVMSSVLPGGRFTVPQITSVLFFQRPMFWQDAVSVYRFFF